MLACVALLCTSFIIYICRMDWRKAAEEVTPVLVAPRSAAGRATSALTRITVE